MIAVALALASSTSPASLHAVPVFPGTWESFVVVTRLDGSDFRKGEIAGRMLHHRPQATLALLWGQSCDNLEIAKRCRTFYADWATFVAQPWRELMRRCRGDFDVFVSQLLAEPLNDPLDFAGIAFVGAALDRFMVHKSLRRIAPEPVFSLSPFNEFAAYQRAHSPRIVGELVGDERFANVLARIEFANAKYLSNSIVVARGNVTLYDCTRSLIVSGGDVAIERGMGESIVIASGKITLGSATAPSSHVGRGMVIGGDAARIVGAASQLFVMAPGKVDVSKRSLSKNPNIVVRDGGLNPESSLFRFRDLNEFGLSVRQQGQTIQVERVADDSPLARILRAGDSVCRANNETIASVGQFRRVLVGMAAAEQFDFMILRDGQKLRLVSPVRRHESARPLSSPIADALAPFRRIATGPVYFHGGPRPPPSA